MIYSSKKRFVSLAQLTLCLILFSISTLCGQSKNEAVRLINRIPPDDKSITITNATAIDIDFAGNVFIVDRDRNQLLKFSQDGQLLDQVGGFGQAAEQFADPLDVVAQTPLDVFIADYNNNRVVRYDKNLNFLNTLTSSWPEPYNFERVISIAVSQQYDLFLLEESSRKIVKFSRFSEPTAAFGGIYETYGQLLEPVQMCLDGSQRLFVSDPAQEAIVVFDYLGNYIQTLNHPDLNSPGGITWGDDKRLYVVHQGTADIYIFSQHLKFLGIISLSSYVEEIVDVAIKTGKDNSGKRILALGNQECFVFQFQP